MLQARVLTVLQCLPTNHIIALNWSSRLYVCLSVCCVSDWIFITL